MTNSAWYLHELLTKWAPEQGESVNQARERVIGTSGLSFWQAHGRAVMLLADIERLLDGMSSEGMRVEAFREALPAWYAALFAPRFDWNQGPQHSHGSQKSRITINKNARLDMLSALGAALDGFHSTEELDEITLNDLVGALDEAEDIVRLLDDIPKDERVYMLGLIEEARRVAKDVQTFGSAQTRLSSMQLGSGLLAASERTNDPSKKEKLIQAAKRVLGFFAPATQKAIETGITEQMKQLISGE